MPVEFVTPLTFETLSGNPVATDLFRLTGNFEIDHIALAEFAELVVIAPATANLIGKMAAGIADDLLTTVLLAATAPVLICPAMNAKMYANPDREGKSWRVWFPAAMPFWSRDTANWPAGPKGRGGFPMCRRSPRRSNRS